MAERSNLSNKLKLVVSYRDANDNEKTRQITFKNLKGDADATAVYDAAEALAGLQEDALIRVSEVSENVIEGQGKARRAAVRRWSSAGRK